MRNVTQKSAKNGFAARAPPRIPWELTTLLEPLIGDLLLILHPIRRHGRLVMNPLRIFFRLRPWPGYSIR